jgi:hypothetical protein
VYQCAAEGADFGKQLSNIESRRVYGCANPVTPVDACGESTINGTLRECIQPFTVAFIKRGGNCTFAYKVRACAPHCSTAGVSRHIKRKM